MLTATAATFAILSSGCASDPSSRYRQKMTVEVETPDGLKTGSSVMEVRYTQISSWGGGISTNGNALLGGEAVVVEVAPGRVLFALLSPPPEKGGDSNGYQVQLIGTALNAGAPADPEILLPEGRYGFSVTDHAAIGASGVKVTLPERLYPLLVTFGDLQDPTSVKRVEPGNLAESLGEGVRLKAIRVAVTDEPVTVGIERRLGWLPTHRGTLKPNPPRFLEDPRDTNLVTLDAGPFSKARFQ